MAQRTSGGVGEAVWPRLQADPFASTPGFDQAPTGLHAVARRGAGRSEGGLLHRWRLRWEISLSKLMVVLTVAALVAVASIWDDLGSELATPLLVLGFVIGTYFALYWQLLERGFVRMRPWMRWVNITIEGSLTAVIMLLIARVKGAAWALSSPSFMLYSIIIVASATRMRPAMCLYCGAVSIVSYLLVYALAIRPHIASDVHELLPTLKPWAVAHRVFWLAVIAGVVAFVTHEMVELASRMNREASQRAAVEHELGRFVSKDVAAAILRGETSFGRAERRDVSVLFCDLRDFTSLCEREAPEDIVHMLNTFYEAACDIVHRHGGTVNKFMGDGLLALFGAPHEHPDHVHAAAEAAHEIMYAAKDLRSRGGSIWRRFDVGIGLDSGDVVVGELGASNRAEYTAIGNTVNRAARLQGLSREGEHHIVLSDDFVARLGPRANVVSMGSIRLKGITRPVQVYAFRHS